MNSEQTQPRVGVIGAGYWGKNLIRNAHELGALVSVCDGDEGALARTRQAYPEVSTLSDYKAMLKGPIDAVIIAAPAVLHAELALAAIAAGKHVFVEKPLALTVDDGLAVAAAAEEAGLICFVGHVLLYHPAVETLLAHIRSGHIGDVFHVRSRRLNLGRLRTEEDVWWSFAPHDVALMLEIMPDPPLGARSSRVSRLSHERADFAYVDYEFPAGRSAHIEVGWLDPTKSQRLDVFGTTGVLTFEDGREGALITCTPCGARPDAAGRLQPWREPEIELASPAREPLRSELQAFFNAIRSGQRPRTDAREGVAVLRALAMADATAHHTHLLPEVTV